MRAAIRSLVQDGVLVPIRAQARTRHRRYVVAAQFQRTLQAIRTLLRTS
jgi:hypothetical protein